MLRRTVQGCVELASELADEVGKRVVGTAAELLERSGVDLSEVERRLGGQFPPSVKSIQTLAGEAVTAGRAGVDVAVGVARSEVEKAFERVGDQVTKVGVVLAYLESKLREVEEEAVPPAGRSAAGARADGLFGDGWEHGEGGAEPIVAERVEVDEADEDSPAPAPAPARSRKAAAEPTRAARTPAEPAPAAKEPVEEAPAKEARARKAPAAKARAGEAGTGKSQAKKAAAKKTPARKTVVTKKATAEQPSGKPAGKRAAAKKTTVRRSTSGKGGDD
ncbi:hypothetical protein [Kitasatospora sp. NPDC050543]|uniref:hypothetical protein n=1 Tax=Kitasatospora sp. NPDC050543 TaxID=3364054 RepID=UPI0037947AA2